MDASAELKEAWEHGRAGRYEEAQAIAARVLAREPGHPGALHLMGAAAYSQRRYDLAEGYLNKSLETAPQDRETLGTYAAMLMAQGREEEALAAARRLLELDPNSLMSLTCMGCVLAGRMDFAEAMPLLERAMKLAPQNRNVLLSLGAARSAMGDFEGAKQVLGQAVIFRPDDPEIAMGLAIAHLLSGNWQRGWEWYAKRWHPGGPARRHTQIPAWNGQDLRGKRILVWTEQGYGDAIQFIRYGAWLKQQGAAILVECAPALKALFALYPHVDAVRQQGETLPPFDFQIPLLDLARMHGTTPMTVPASVPYLRADARKVSSWRQRLAKEAPGLRVGLAWAGNPDHPKDHFRSVALADLAGLGCGGVTFVSLQVGKPEGQATPEGMRLIRYAQKLSTFEETAALMENLDLVITVDTAIAHLAGALGRPVWTLLPFSCDWRWLAGRDDTPWYPTMRLFRQKRPRDWAEVIGRVRAELSAWIAGRGQGAIK